MNNDIIETIIWKIKDNQIICIKSNCEVKQGSVIDSYLNTITYNEQYKNLIKSNKKQIIDIKNKKILIYVLSNMIIEIRMDNQILTNDNKYLSENNLHILSLIGHKIKNPLTELLNILSFMDQLKLNKEEQKNINIIKKASYDIIDIVNDIIDIININNNGITLFNEHVKIINVLNDCHNIISNTLKNKNLNFKFSIDKNVPDIIVVDSIKLKQIIINILKNSIENTNIGSIIIEVILFDKNNNCIPYEFLETIQPTYNIMFSIKDTGNGMDDNTKNIVTDILSNGSFNNIYMYDGLGLIISKHFCNLLKGKIWFKTEKNIGTVFCFNIICDGFFSKVI